MFRAITEAELVTPGGILPPPLCMWEKSRKSVVNYIVCSTPWQNDRKPLAPVTCKRVSPKHGVMDGFAFLRERAIFRHPPNKIP
jgi:hypothetical protein